MARYQLANQTIKGVDAGAYTGGPYKGLLHTTESGSATSAIAAFKANISWPHFLVDYAGKVWQFIDTTKAARALVNAPGGVETNTDSVIQIEIVGYAGRPNDHPAAQVAAVAALMRWLEKTHGIKPEGPGRPFASAYGQTWLRFTRAEWDNFAGYCGHCHVPEGNKHWDPGNINLALYLPLKPVEVRPMFDPPLVLEPIAAHIAHNGGQYLVASSGAIYSFDAPPIRGPNGEEYWGTRKAAQVYAGDSTNSEIPVYITRPANGLIIRATDGAWYGPYAPA